MAHHPSRRRRHPQENGGGEDFSTSPSQYDNSETSSPKTKIVTSNAKKAICPKFIVQPSKMNMTPKKNKLLMTWHWRS